MTIIAFDGKTLAADKASTSYGYRRTVTKIFLVPGGMVGMSGCGDQAQMLRQWFLDGRNPANWPKAQTEGQGCNAMFIDTKGRILHYSQTPIPVRHEGSYDAIGSGRDYALAALFLGRDARRAVVVASALDIHCGGGIDVLTMEQCCANSPD